ncbi:MAG: InlB B-repeat-containing protein [Bacillota bacterium]|nr:InlB B-repeat-containing protein [Bacillota bacterium]
MKRSLKFLTAITLSLLLVFGSSLGAFAEQNTSIHLKTGFFKTELAGSSFYVYLEGHVGTDPDYYSQIGDDRVTILPMTTSGGGGLYTTPDLTLAVDPKIKYFEIGSLKYYVGTHIFPDGNEGQGSVNYRLTSMPVPPDGSITIIKTLSGDTPSIPGTFEFEIYAVGETDQLYLTVPITGANTKEIKGVPQGNYYVTESGMPSNYNLVTENNKQSANVTSQLLNPSVSFENNYSKPTTYTITYHANFTGFEEFVPVDSNSYEAGNQATVLSKPLSLDVPNYSFGGWNTQDDGLGDPYVAGDPLTMPARNVNLYAKWVPKLPPPPPTTTYSLTYNGNGATSGTAPAPPTSYSTGTEVTVLGNSGGYEISGMNFDGWNTESNGSGTPYRAVDLLTITTTDVVLYAQWSESIPTVGTITIEKVITGDEPLPGTIFEFRIIGFDGEDSYVINDEPIYIDGNGSTKPYEVPTGLIRVVEINIPPNYRLLPDEPREVVLDVESGFDRIVRFENEYKEPRGSITVNKTLTGDTPIPDRTFTFRLVGPAGEGSTSTELSRTGAGAVTFSGLTYGTYTLTEVGLPSNFSIVSGNNVQLSIHEESRNIAANITNRYTEPIPPPPPPTPTPETGIVRVHYIHIDERVLDPIFEFSSPIGNSYNTVARDYEDLELVETPENASGTIIDGVIDVFYVYSPGVEPLFILEVEEETPLGPPVVPEEEIVLTEPVPLAPLPQTGQLPAELFYGLGTVISMIGIAFRKGRKSR